jgi:hypothetical protein
MPSKLILFRGPCFGSRSHCPHGVDLLSLDLERLSVRFVMHKYAERWEVYELTKGATNKTPTNNPTTVRSMEILLKPLPKISKAKLGATRVPKMSKP